MNVLFVCTGNICRSPMAAGLMSALLPSHLKGPLKVESAGTHALTGHLATDYAIAAMGTRSIDISSHRARQLDRAMLAKANLVLVMEPAHLDFIRTDLKCPTDRVEVLVSHHTDNRLEQIDDPYGSPLPAYQACLRDMEPCIKNIISRIDAGFGLTLRQQIMALLAGGPQGLPELAEMVQLTEKDLVHHLQHLQRTANRSGARLSIEAACCRNCGFGFRSSKTIKRPGRCPRCKQSRIDGPWLTLKHTS